MTKNYKQPVTEKQWRRENARLRKKLLDTSGALHAQREYIEFLQRLLKSHGIKF